MAKPDDIEATEKLLRLIRQNQISGEDSTLPVHDIPQESGEGEAVLEETEEHVGNVATAPSSMLSDKSQKLEMEADDAEESSPPPLTLPEDKRFSVKKKTTDHRGGEAGPADEREPVFISGQMPVQESPPAIPPGQRFSHFWAAAARRLNPRPASLIIGIDIQPDAINLAKVRRGGARPRLVDCLRVPFPVEPGSDVSDRQISFQLLRGTPWFHAAFQTALAELCPPGTHYEIWCTISNDFIETYNITLPKLTPREVANAVYWSAKKEASFDDQQVVFDYAVLGEVQVKGQLRISTVVYLASKSEIDAIAGFFSSLGRPLSGITTHATAIQNQLRDDFKAAPNEAVSHLHVGDHKSFIDVYSNGQLVFSRDIKTGLNSFTDPIFELALEQKLNISEAAAREMIFKEDLSILHQNPYFRPLIRISEGVPVLELPAIGRLVRQLQRTFSYCATNFNIPKMSRVLVSGLPGAPARFVRQIQLEVGVECTLLDPFQDGMLMEEGLEPSKEAFRQFLVSALGLTLSDGLKTQNFLCTYSEKEKKQAVNKLNRTVILATTITACVLLGIFAWERILLFSTSKKLDAVRNEIAATASGSTIDALRAHFMEKVKEAKDSQQDFLHKSRRFLHLAFAGEYSVGYPSQVKIIKVSVASIEEPAETKKEKDKAKEKNPKAGKTAPAAKQASEKSTGGGVKPGEPEKEPQYRVILEGIVLAEERYHEFVLADLLKKIAEIPYSVGQPSIDSKTIENYSGQKVLHFVVSTVAGASVQAEQSSTHGEAKS